ncbi:MAG TPA: hypothetical protein VK864_04040, partial [Longimicrobiales bacterium]|nr:hypothetical protein [Longimicrobiales bacterium]
KDGRTIAQQLVDETRAVLGPRLQCGLLYGSYARREAIPGVSDVNVMLLLDNIDPATLAAVAPVVRRWVDSRQTPPLILEREQWRRATDVFAIELSDMRDSHELLYGQDFAAGEVISLNDLRNQAERELRGKLLQLQTGMLVGSGSGDSLGELLKRALPSFTTYLRAVLRLIAHPVPGTTPAVIQEAMTAINGSPDAFLEVWEARSNRQRLKVSLQDSLVHEYHTAAEQTAVFVDHMREVGE